MTTTTNCAAEMLTWIEARLADGATVNVCTMTRVTQITPAAVARWQAAGRPLFKLSADGLRIGRGKHYDLIATPSAALVRVTSN